MEHISLVRTELLISLIDLVEVLWCGAGLVPMPSWICLIECSYYFIDVIYHSNLDSATFSVVKCNPEVVMNLASMGGNSTYAVFKDTFILLLEPCDNLAHYLWAILG